MLTLTRFCTLFFLVLSLPLWGQDDEKPRRKLPPLTHQVGLNATSVLEKVLKLGKDSIYENPYLLTYRLGVGHVGLRMGLNATKKYERQSEAGFADSKTTLHRTFNGRIGLDYQQQFGRRFSGNFGFDFMAKNRLDKETLDSGFDVVQRTEQFTGWGFGPMIGLCFWMNAHLGIYTEANFYLIKGKTEIARNFKNFPELDDTLFYNESEELTKVLPSSIFLVYRF